MGLVPSESDTWACTNPDVADGGVVNVNESGVRVAGMIGVLLGDYEVRNHYRDLETLERANEAYDRMMSGKARFRAVLAIGK